MTPETLPQPEGPFEIFISYARADDKPDPPTRKGGFVTGIHRFIIEDHRKFTTEPLRIFFDKSHIKDMDDWRHGILGALRKSKVLLVCLSPNYFKSKYCRWEFDEYVRMQVHGKMGHEGFAQVYFVEVRGTPELENARGWYEMLRQSHSEVNLIPWFPQKEDALRDKAVEGMLEKLGQSLAERIIKARLAESLPGNLRRQNPFFVGRVPELRELHEKLAVNRVGMVTAVHGLGGQGKTELAVAYANAYASGYPAGLWVLPAEGRKELLPLIGELALDPRFDYAPNEAEKQNAALLGRKVLELLRQRGKDAEWKDADGGAAALLILDNVSETSLLSGDQLQDLPDADFLRIVATTRLAVQPIKGWLGHVEVDSLDEESALALMRDHQPPRDPHGRIVTDEKLGLPRFASIAEEDAAREIVRALGGFTLAVEQAAIYLGIHTEVPPSAFLASLRKQGLQDVDELGADPDVSHQMLTQNKQLGLILEATLNRLSPEETTALHVAALLPPDMVPWPWLRQLTTQAHPEIELTGRFGSDPWLDIIRKLTGLRLLTPGDASELARIHRLVAAHVGLSVTSFLNTTLIALLRMRSDDIYEAQEPPENWEMDALLAALPHTLQSNCEMQLAVDALFLAEKVLIYRTLSAAATLLNSTHSVIERLAKSDPGNAEWQRDLSVSLNKLGDLCVAQGDLSGGSRRFEESLAIRERLAKSDPGNAGWQRDLSVSLEKLGDLCVAQGDLTGGSHRFEESLSISERLAKGDPGNAGWQRDLSVSLNKLGDLCVAQGDLAGGSRRFEESLAIFDRLAKSDPSNAGWQRDLCVSHMKLYGLAQQSSDTTWANNELNACFQVLQNMRQCNMHMDPPLKQLYEQLNDMFGVR